MKYQFLKTIFALVGISILTYSCTPTVESKVKKYSNAGKTIIASTMGQDTEDNCIIYADTKGVFFDNMKDVSQILLFGKTYTCVSSELSVPCEKKGLEINLRSQGNGYTFSLEEIVNYDIYPIGDWATILCGRNEWGSDIPSFIIKNGSDTIYEIDSFERWHSKYQLKYDDDPEIVEYEGIDEYGNIFTGTSVSTGTYRETGDEEQEYIAINLHGGFDKLQNDCDKLSPYFEKFGQNFHEWYKQYSGSTIFSAELIITPERFFDVNTITSIEFTNLSMSFKYAELGSATMYKQLASAIYSKYQVDKEEKAKREKQEQIQYVLDQCVDIEEVARDLRNEIAAERKYSGKQILLNLKLLSINRIDSRYTYNQYILDAQYVNVTLDKTIWIEISCYTDDENFVELSYPHHCVLAGELMVDVSSPTNLIFENCELFLY